jgi:hypothetical protein
LATLAAAILTRRATSVNESESLNKRYWLNELEDGLYYRHSSQRRAKTLGDRLRQAYLPFMTAKVLRLMFAAVVYTASLSM